MPMCPFWHKVQPQLSKQAHHSWLPPVWETRTKLSFLINSPLTSSSHLRRCLVMQGTQVPIPFILWYPLSWQYSCACNSQWSILMSMNVFVLQVIFRHIPPWGLHLSPSTYYPTHTKRKSGLSNYWFMSVWPSYVSVDDRGKACLNWMLYFEHE